ncbi:alcohol dehydrogenase catalytic domain-containing protein [Pimelobacter simplex]|uniref:Alcohol dehydrogenase n=1 Tax=Nocardioides simplex TaxID=2045 RepID=A0A0C5XCU0_NOCSI|nr:alcohol dehydrogenase catalytic domain-containing protein [Pimelobacter simplex]AJR18619.1 Alcohol dehydrogenase [Pimelobacter simplex]MCG8153880.1 alcohol dehydrogenase catalytic domain-containing protein [Pimelobacter simplex]GEB16307.1 L-threonine 3-dehydrogenase [Pimelobacter simplex]
MQAVVVKPGFVVDVAEVPEPRCGPGDVVIAVRRVQLSVTECMLLAGADVALSDQLARRLEDGPLQFGGHEFAGEIIALGTAVDPEATGLRVGQRVTAVETLPCGTCAACRRSWAGACVAPAIIGFTRPGALAERVVVPASAVVPVPDGVSLSAAAAIQPLAGAVHAHAALDVRPGESVLVLGGGVMGLLGVAVARHGNAGLVALSTHSPRKLELGRRFGADALIDAGSDVLATALELTDGIGFDVVLETAGGSADVGLAGLSTVELAAQAVRRGGRIAMVSVLDAHAPLPTGLLRSKSVTLVHPRSGAGDYASGASVFEHSFGLVQRNLVDPDALITHTVPGLGAIHEAMDITQHKSRYGAINPAQMELS